MSHPSSVNTSLSLLTSSEDFQRFALQLLADTRRHITILSNALDPAVFNSPEFIDAISEFARSSRHTRIQILIKNSKPLAEKGHALVTLAQRLPSKIEIRKLTLEPDNKRMEFMLCDTKGLLYKNDDAVYQGFANLEAGAEVKRFRTIFEYLWQYAEPDPNLQKLHI